MNKRIFKIQVMNIFQNFKWNFPVEENLPNAFRPKLCLHNFRDGLWVGGRDTERREELVDIYIKITHTIYSFQSAWLAAGCWQRWRRTTLLKERF